MSSFSVNQDLDTDCKKVYDRCSKVAARQGQTAWLKELYHDDDRLCHMLTRFKDQFNCRVVDQGVIF